MQANTPDAIDLTTAPLRHRLRVALDAPVGEVWALVGDHARLPEYSAGIAHVEVPDDRVRVCHFRPQPGAAEGVVLRERIRWQARNFGYAASAEPDNAFGLTNDLSIVTVVATGEGTMFTWVQHYDHGDLPAMRAGFDAGIADIGERLVARFGGRVVERYVDGPRAAA
jgi:hypothetical protein